MNWSCSELFWKQHRWTQRHWESTSWLIRSWAAAHSRKVQNVSQCGPTYSQVVIWSIQTYTFLPENVPLSPGLFYKRISLSLLALKFLDLLFWFQKETLVWSLRYTLIIFTHEHHRAVKAVTHQLFDLDCSHLSDDLQFLLQGATLGGIQYILLIWCSGITSEDYMWCQESNLSPVKLCTISTVQLLQLDHAVLSWFLLH